MRSIFHEILARYLDSEQHAFDASPRELWPETRASWHPLAQAQPASRPVERSKEQRVYRELEPQN
jgi:hypothetical protein